MILRSNEKGGLVWEEFTCPCPNGKDCTTNHDGEVLGGHWDERTI